MSLVITTTHSLDYDTNENSKTLKVKVQKPEKPLYQTFDRSVNPTDSVLSKKSVLSENTMKYIFQKCICKRRVQAA